MIKLLNCTLQYINLAEPRQYEGQNKAVYSCCVLLKEGAELKKLKNAVLNVKSGHPKLVSLPDGKWTNPIRDGNEEKAGDLEFKDCFFINAKSSQKPQIVGSIKGIEIDPADIKPGASAHVMVELYPYDKNGGKGVGVVLLGVMFLQNNGQKTYTADELFGDLYESENFDFLS